MTTKTTAQKLTPAMQRLVDDLRAGTAAVYRQPMETRQDLLLRYSIDTTGQTWGGRRLSPTAWGLVGRGILVPATDKPDQYVLAAGE